MARVKAQRTTAEQIETWRAERAAGRSNREIALRHGCDEGLVRYYLDRKGKAAASKASESPAPAPAEPAPTPSPPPVDPTAEAAEGPLTPAEFTRWLSSELRTHQRSAQKFTAAGDSIQAQRASRLAASIAALLSKAQARDDSDESMVRVRVQDMEAAATRVRAKVHDLLARFTEDLER